MDSYQAIYDAVRSRIRGGDVNAAIAEAFNHASLGHYVAQASGRIGDCAIDIAHQMTRPSVLYRPSIGRDGSVWSVLYGSNLMEGIAGFGETVEAAMRDFDKNWETQKVGGSASTNATTPA